MSNKRLPRLNTRAVARGVATCTVCGTTIRQGAACFAIDGNPLCSATCRDKWEDSELLDLRILRAYYGL